VAFVAASLAACQPSSELDFVSAPTVMPNPNPRAPLVAVISFATDKPVNTTIEINDGERSWSIEFDAAHETGQGLAILGMKPDREHSLQVSIKDEEGNVREAATALTFKTPPLPEGLGAFAPIKVISSKPELMEPGFTILSVRRRVPGRSNWITPKQRKFMTSWGLVVALDSAGDVVWYYEADKRISGIDRLRNGHLLFHLTDFRTVELDMLGNEVASWYAADRPAGPAEGAIPIIGAQTLHHQPLETPTGSFMSFSANAREVKDYYTSEYDSDAPRKTQMVMGDSVIEFDRDGNILWRWETWDHLDPYRVGYELLDPYWHVRGFPDHADWTHGNGLAYDPRDESVIINLKLQDALFKIDKASGEIQWILGEHTDWPDELKSKLLQPVGEPFKWIHHAHNPRITKSDTIIIYDNGSMRARPFKRPLAPHESFSRAVEYEVDEENMTVRQVWASHSGPEPDACASMAMGDAHELPATGNILVVDSLCDYRGQAQTWDPWDFSKRQVFDVIHWSRIREYRRDGSTTEVVFDVEVRDPHEVLQWEVFGGLRTPRLYPAR
jgi:arylsulfate sulfotransferase